MNDQNTNTKSSPGQEPNEFKLRAYLANFFHEVVDIKDGVDKLSTINEIKSKKTISGPNAWMLMCSIVIASIGLDLNSPAVIIGAMLISPLMSPILGMGLAIGINDKDTLKSSLTHFGMAVAIALITSALYFVFTPLGDITEEIKGRTGPGPLDILVAFFGGIAGIVSIARKDMSTTLPGVAIATALMPPLCVTGFGIASGNGVIALSSFFLFFINTVFVSFATFLMVKFVLKFPQRDFINPTEERKNGIFIGLFLLLIAVISYFPFKKIITETKDKQKLEIFFQNTLKDNRKFLDDFALTHRDDKKVLVMKVYGDSISNRNKAIYLEGLKYCGLNDIDIEIISTSEITMENIMSLDKKINGMEELASKLSVVKEQKEEAFKAIENIKKEINTLQMDSVQFIRIANELKVLHPEITNITYAKGQSSDFSHYEDKLPIMWIEWNKSSKHDQNTIDKLEPFLRNRLLSPNLKIVHNR